MKRIYEGKLSEILPESVMSDERLGAAARALDVELQRVSGLIVQVLHLPRLDELPEKVLDLLAWQLHCDFYEPEGMDVETKRGLIRQSIKWHRIKGTKAAVLELARTMMSDAQIEEWFEYGGEPYRFKLTATGLRFDDDDAATFFRMIESVKNARSWLENVLVDLTRRDSDLKVLPDKLHIAQVWNNASKIHIGLHDDQPAPQPLAITQWVQDLTHQTLKLDLPAGSFHEIKIGQIIHEASRLLVKAELGERDDSAVDFEKYLREHWRRFKSDPLIQHYAHRDEFDILDPDVIETFPLSRDFLKLYFKIGKSSKVRTLTVERLREGISSAEVKNFGSYVVNEGILTSRSGEEVVSMKSAFLVKRTVEDVWI